MTWLRSIIKRITERLERKGAERYEPRQDPAIRHLTLQRIRSERAMREASRDLSETMNVHPLWRRQEERGHEPG